MAFRTKALGRGKVFVAVPHPVRNDTFSVWRLWRAGAFCICGASKFLMDEHHATSDAPDATSSANDSFYASALPRIRNFMLGLAPILTGAAWLRFGPRAAAGFVIGCAIAYLNFQWLKSGVSSLADRVTNTGKPQSGKGMVARFLLRYALLGGAAYVILTSFPASLRGLFAGLFLPVGGIACEAVYELYAAVIHRV